MLRVLLFLSHTPGTLSQGCCSPFTKVSESDSYLWVVYTEVSEINTELQLLFACELVSKMITRYCKYTWHVEIYFQLQRLQIALSKTNKQNNGGIYLELFIMRRPKS